MTGEDVLGQWLQRIGLDQQPVLHGTGWLNKMGRELGTRPPFRQRIRDVCGQCNGGWMSRLESTAKEVLTPFILGTIGSIGGADLGAIAAWVQKTSLTAMYISTAEDRAAGYGAHAADYHELYEIRDERQPLPHSQFWMGKFDGTMDWSVRVAPVAVVVDGFSEPEFPDGYLMTIVLGQLLLQGVHMTTPDLELRVRVKQRMRRIWPNVREAKWPRGKIVYDDNYESFALGRDLLVENASVSLRPWKRATELPASQLSGDMIELPTICGKHIAHYPAILAFEAVQDRFYAFTVSCACGLAYLIHTEPDGAHCKAAGDPADISRKYDELVGDKDEFTNGLETFRCKRLPVQELRLGTFLPDRYP